MTRLLDFEFLLIWVESKLSIISNDAFFFLVNSNSVRLLCFFCHTRNWPKYLSNWTLIDCMTVRYSHLLFFLFCFVNVGVVQSLSHVWFFATPWTAACKASQSFTISGSLFTLMSIESVIPSNHLILCPLSSTSLPALNLSQHQGLF